MGKLLPSFSSSSGFSKHLYGFQRTHSMVDIILVNLVKSRDVPLQGWAKVREITTSAVRKEAGFSSAGAN